MTDKRPSSAKLRRDCFEANKRVDEHGRIYLICHLTGARIDPTRDKWEAEHPIRRVLIKHDKGLKPVLVLPHKEKTKRDISENAKGKRVADKHVGIVRKSGFRRPEGKYNWKTGRYERAK